MSGGGGGTNTNTVEKADPWEPIQPYLTQAAGDLKRTYNEGAPEYYPYQTYVSPNEWQVGGVEALQNYANSDQLWGSLNQAYNANTSLLNPYSDTNAAYSMGMAQPSAYTTRALMAQGLGYNPNIYAPDAGVAGYADPNYALSQVMYGGGQNPYLDQMVNAAQLNSMQNYGQTTDKAANAYQYQIAPQIQDARTLIDDALNTFTERALPQITDSAVSSGNINSTRTDLAEGTALSGIYDTLNRDLTNLARTSDLTGANVYQDMLRNQNYAMDDVNAMASSMYGGSWDQGQQNLLNAAGIAGGLQTNWNNAQIEQAKLGLEAQSLNQLYSGQAADRSLDAANLGFDTFGNTYADAYNNSVRSLGLMPQTMQLGAYPSNLYNQIGNTYNAWDQQALSEDMARWDYAQNADINYQKDYINTLLGLGGMGSSVNITGQNPAANPYLSTMGGAAMGGGLAYGLMGLGATNPWGWAMMAGGAGLGYLGSR